MRFLALVLPRLGIQLLRSSRADLVGRPVGLLSGEGDAALVSVVSCEATADGAEPGMTVLQARQRSRGIAFERDNARECLEKLEGLASILRTRATTNVAIVSRNAVAIELDGFDAQFTGEGAAAHALLAVARNWTGLDVRAAVASTVEEAVHAARTARRFPVVLGQSESSAAVLPEHAPIAASFAWDTPVEGAAVIERLSRMVASFQPLMSAYGSSFRLVTVEMSHGAYRSQLNIRPSQPIHRPSEVLELLKSRLSASVLDGLTTIRVTLGLPGPNVNIDPWRSPVATMHQLSGPAVPVQRRLLRAS